MMCLLLQPRHSSGGPGVQVAVVPEGAADVQSLVGLLRLVAHLDETAALGAAPHIVVDSGTGTSAIGTSAPHASFNHQEVVEPA